MPAAIVPMKATLVDKPPRGEEWLFEIKWDGVRAIAFIDHEQVRLMSRTGNWCEKQYPELSVIHHSLAAEQAILDTEIAVLDEKGVSRFAHDSAAHRGGRSEFDRAPGALASGDDVRLRPAVSRRLRSAAGGSQRAEAAGAGAHAVSGAARSPTHFPDAGEQLLEAARENGLEGIVAKHARVVTNRAAAASG